jgi:hypothetical protein
VTTGDRTKSAILTAADWVGKEGTIEKMSVHRTTMVLFTVRTEFTLQTSRGFSPAAPGGPGPIRSLLPGPRS